MMAEGQIQRALSVLGDDEEIVLFEGLDQDVQIDGSSSTTERQVYWAASEGSVLGRREQGRADLSKTVRAAS